MSLPLTSASTVLLLMAVAAPRSELCNLTQALCAPPSAAIDHQDVMEFVGQARAWAAAWDELDRPPEARAEIEHCLFEPARRALALAQVDVVTGAFKKSQSRCKALQQVAKKPYQGALWHCRATASMHQGLLQQGEQELHMGLASSPRSGPLRLTLAQVQLAQHLPHAAHDTLLALLHQDGGVPATVLTTARRLTDEAKNMVAPPLTPSDKQEQAFLTKVMEAGSHDQDDLEHVRFLAETSLQPQLWSSCALVLLRNQNSAQGRNLLHQAELALPLDADPSRLLAVYHLSVDDYPGALSALMRAVRKQPFDAESQVMLAEVASRLNRWDVTHSAYKTLVQLEPDRASHRSGLMEARQRLRQQNSATTAP